MSSLTKITILGVQILTGALLVTGCGSSSSNSKATFNSDTQQHADGWLSTGHETAAQADMTACTECHGSDYLGGISGRSCLGSKCHTVSPATATGCSSCHDKPPTGSVAPNINGAHTAHNAAPSIKNVCDTCHTGAGSGSDKHVDGTVDVSLLSTYNAKSGALVYNSDGTCSKISCHGGQTTPGWNSGTSIDVNTQCTSCHAFGTTEYNSYESGEHLFHVITKGILCVSCHDSAKLGMDSNHFKYLDTTVMEGPAAASLNSSLNYAGNSCTPKCHGLDFWQ